MAVGNAWRRILPSLGCALLLAGCGGKDAGPNASLPGPDSTDKGTPHGPAPAEPGQTLEDLQTCAYRFEDGSPVPCSSDAASVPWLDEPPSDWYCVHLESGFSLWRSLVGDEYGLVYESPGHDGTVRGWAQVHWGTINTFVNWTAADDSTDGFIRLGPPMLAQTDPFILRGTAFGDRFTTNLSDLFLAVVAPLYSMHEEAVWLLPRVDAGGVSYYPFGPLDTTDALQFLSGRFVEGRELQYQLDVLRPIAMNVPAPLAILPDPACA